LLDYPINELKISPSLTRRAVSNASAAACVRASITFATGNALRLVAMGIETPEQADFMLKAGVQCGQGYWFGRPLPGSEVAPLLAWSANEGVGHSEWDRWLAVAGGAG
jgi:EAL domain-containing protein (putative c-di-GMP-specific phosphodiesterase class I)